MAITEETANERIDVSNLAKGYPAIHVRTEVITKDNGAEISRAFFRHVLMPDADLSSETADVVAIANTVFTADAQAAYATAQTEQEYE